MALTLRDVERLAGSPTARIRIDVAAKVAEAFVAGELTVREKSVAVEIFQLLVRDAEVKVREALSMHLHSSSLLPHDIAFAMAQDVDSVSVAVLEFSAVLDDADFAAIIRSTRRTLKLAAIARREHVSYAVSDLLLDVGDPAVTTDLFRNRGADIREEGMLRAVGEMASQEMVIDALVERGGLPVACVEKIFTCVSVAMKRRLASRYHVSRHLIEGRMEYAREWATLGSATKAEDDNVESLVRSLMEQRKLTSSLIVRSLCVGDLRFFEHSLAALADLPIASVRSLMLDAGEAGFYSLYRKSPLPPAYYQAVKTLLEVTFEVTHNGRSTPEDFSKRVVDAIVARGYDKKIEYMPLLMAIIQGSVSELASVH